MPMNKTKLLATGALIQGTLQELVADLPSLSFLSLYGILRQGDVNLSIRIGTSSAHQKMVIGEYRERLKEPVTTFFSCLSAFPAYHPGHGSLAFRATPGEPIKGPSTCLISLDGSHIGQARTLAKTIEDTLEVEKLVLAWPGPKSPDVIGHTIDPHNGSGILSSGSSAGQALWNRLCFYDRPLIQDFLNGTPRARFDHAPAGYGVTECRNGGRTVVFNTPWDLYDNFT